MDCDVPLCLIFTLVKFHQAYPRGLRAMDGQRASRCKLNASSIGQPPPPPQQPNKAQ